MTFTTDTDTFKDAVDTSGNSINWTVVASKTLQVYDGKQDIMAFRSWQKGLERFFVITGLTEDTKKITLAQMYLVGLASSWADSFDLIKGWTCFLEELERECIPADLRSSLISKLRNLRQRTSALEYRRQFDEIHAHVDITDDEAKRTFLEGLKMPLRHYVVAQLAMNPNSGLRTAQTIAVQVDASLYNNKGGIYGYVPSATKTSQYNGPQPMEIEHLKAIHIKRNKSHKGKESFRCFKCGKEGHYARNCKNTNNHENHPNGEGSFN